MRETDACSGAIAIIDREGIQYKTEFGPFEAVARIEDGIVFAHRQ